jgi:hypothetical protein
MTARVRGCTGKYQTEVCKTELSCINIAYSEQDRVELNKYCYVV